MEQLTLLQTLFIFKGVEMDNNFMQVSKNLDL